MEKCWKLNCTVLVLLSFCSCHLLNQDNLTETGTVTYYASSSNFSYADNIQFKDINGNWQNTGKTSLPYQYSYYLDNVNTSNLDPAEFYVQIGSMTNTSGGSLHTTCTFSKNFRNSDDTISYQPGIAISQDSWARIYPNTF